MTLTDVARLAFGALARQRRRTLLSLLGLAIGVAAVVVLTAVGQGARAYVARQFEVLGANMLIVLPGKVETTGAIPGFGGVPNDLTLLDAAALRDRIPGVMRVAPLVVGNDTLEHAGRNRQVAAIGTTSEYAAVRSFTFASGRFLPEGPWDRGAPVAVLGAKLADELFPGEAAVGGYVRLGGWRLRVEGVLQPQGMTFGFDMDEAIFVPVSVGMRMFDRRTLFRIVVQMRPGSDMDLAAERVEETISRRHGEEDVTITTPEAVMGSLDAILAALTLAVAGIAAVSLCVAGIGIMNVMLVAVAERRGEIGLLKAIGAGRRQVLSLFLVEAALLSLAGGLVGLVAGWGLVRGLVALVPAFPASPPAWAVASALGLAVATGLIFGYWPARQAVRLDPVTALAGRAR